MIEFLRQALAMRMKGGLSRWLLFFDFLVLAEYFLHYMDPIFFGMAVGSVASRSVRGIVVYLLYSSVVFALQIAKGALGARKIYPEALHHLRQKAFKTVLIKSKDEDPSEETEKIFTLIDDVMVYFSQLPASYVGIIVGMMLAISYMAIKDLFVLILALLSMLSMLGSNVIRERRITPAVRTFSDEQAKLSSSVIDIFSGNEDIALFCSERLVLRWVEKCSKIFTAAAKDLARKEFKYFAIDTMPTVFNVAALGTLGAHVVQGRIGISDATALFFYVEMFSVASDVFSGYFSYFVWVSEKARQFLEEYWGD